ncbi:transcription factor cys6 [Pyrenophora tritici-repentis]|nr:transcription factor cys6 [Pyrenophora tritici-repentis]KAI0610385.1 transcription factor cys6 [Pyrenophora tritici-repentis]PZD00556.1 transcription factor cys6 protein [Pyrenophora tritici-repentis]PZD33595.1 transcription factor cys6 protein [Pyrenophora tritici-repentis]
MATKRPPDDDPNLIHKIQRIEHTDGASPQHRPANNDFSGSVKKKLADSKRTGQACDRCKIRKIRCDGRPEGCTPSQLKEHNIEPRAPPAYNALQPPSHPWSSVTSESQPWTEGPRQTSSSPLPGYAPAGAAAKSETLPHFKHGSLGDNYLGVAAGDSPLSHIKGTSLSIFGTEIDITDFMAGETEYEASPMSYTTLINIAISGQHVDRIELPPYTELYEYTIWYLRSLNPYTMLVHRPVFLDLIWKIGNDPNFTPTAPEIVTVHMMLATIMYQIAIRNSQHSGSTMLQDSHAHYHYALTFYSKLIHGDHGWQDVQALAMICHHLRTFPKPGAAWIMTSTVYLFALQLGLHRSVKVWAENSGKLSKLDIEMRKRVFWCLMALQVNLNGKLGRPMPISNEDMDVEFPEPMNDCIPSEEAKYDAFHQCSFQVGIQVAKYTVLELDLFKSIYAVRHSPKAYLDSLKRLEAGIQQWKDELPYELRDPSRVSEDDHIFSLYLEYWYQAYNLLLHHPGVCRSTDAAVVKSNLDKCLNASQRMLHNCTAMMNKKSLDIPWINTVVYIAAAFTTLFISSIRQDQMSPVDMTKLKGDMAAWVNVLGECDHFLGSGNRLKQAISRIVDGSLSNINDSIVKRTATESLAHVALQAPRSNSVSTYDNNTYRDQYAASSSGPTDPTLTSQSGPYNSMAVATHSYHMGTPMTMPQHTNRNYEQQTYGSGDEANMNPNHAAALAAASSSIAQPSTNAYAYSNAHIGNSSVSAYSYPAQVWSNWTRACVQPPQGQPGDYLNTATTLMTLGRDSGSHASGSDGQGLVQTSGVPGHPPLHWPEISFPNAASGNS